MRALPFVSLLLAACCSTPAAKPAYVEPEAPPPALTAHEPLGVPSGGQSLEDAFPPERLARVGGYDIVVLTILATDGRSGTTNGRPPTLKVRVDEVLAGKVTPGERPGVWSPPPSGVDWSGESARQARAEWEARPLAAPSAGQKLIVLGREIDGVFRLSAKLRAPYSDEARSLWIERIQKPEPRPE